ncbi:MAG: amidohydrolase family protein [Pseudomonadota bacterium]
MEIISAKYMLPMTNGCPVIEDNAIATDLDRIVDIGSKEDLVKRYPTAELKEYPGSVLMPGLVNAHCHLDLVNFSCIDNEEFEPATPPEDPIENLIATILYKQDAKPDRVYVGMQRGAMRLIETGVTCIGDVTHFEGTFRLLDEVGLRAVVFPEVLAGIGPQTKDRFEVALALIDKYMSASHTRIQLGIGPYSPYTLSRQLLKIISQHAREASIPIQIHAAETFAEMEFFFDSQGPIATELFPALGWKELPPEQRKTPIQYLSDIGFLDAPVTIVGALHLSKGDCPLLARNLTQVIYCPSNNEYLKLGTLPYGNLVKAGIPIGIGTEQWRGRLGFNLWEELRIASKRGSNPIPTAQELVRMATIGGARTLGLSHNIGTIENGKKADFIVITPSKKFSKGRLYEDLIETTQPQHIVLVVVNGKILKRK